MTFVIFNGKYVIFLLGIPFAKIEQEIMRMFGTPF